MNYFKFTSHKYFFASTVQYFPRNYFGADNFPANALKMTFKERFGNKNGVVVQNILIFFLVAGHTYYMEQDRFKYHELAGRV